jgi:protoporphyrinogen oxidase
MNQSVIAILGAGPAGLTAAYEFVKRNVQPLILEKTNFIGGIARTESYNGYYFDIGGHRFFTKIKKINALWHEIMGAEFHKVQRLSRIYYRNRFLFYPLKPLDVIQNLGPIESGLVIASYVKSHLFPHPQENTFEQWIINRFGQRLYQMFFKTYTEKVWGMPCNEIQADWAVQRIKGLSVARLIANTFFKVYNATTLIDNFYYPAKGPGEMWERLLKKIKLQNGQLRLNAEVAALYHNNQQITSLVYSRQDKQIELTAAHIVSSIPLARLPLLLNPKAPDEILRAASQLKYRAFIIVILIIDKKDVFPDQWLYVHSPETKVGRIQNFKNWSPDMTPDPNKTSIGMEYFCNFGDALWNLSDAQLVQLASVELEKLGFFEPKTLLDSYVVRQPYAYPVYDAGYKKNLQIIHDYIKGFKNLQTIGRSGLHRYNNMDHSMLTGVLAVENIFGASHDVWNINEAHEYLEEETR